MDGGIDFSSFISAIINFLIVAFVVFCLVKALNKLQNAKKKEAEAAQDEAPAPTCPYCLEDIKEGATRCPHFAGDIAAYSEK